MATTLEAKPTPSPSPNPNPNLTLTLTLTKVPRRVATNLFLGGLPACRMPQRPRTPD